MTNDIQGAIIDLLKSTGREGIDYLIEAMKDGGFFTAPCSGKYHLSCEGGLAIHSMNVFENLDKLNTALELGIETDSIILVALLHDLGKMGDHSKPNYVENILKSGKRSDAEPYRNNPDLTYEEHEIRSVAIAERYIFLTEREEHAIWHHNGLYGKLDSSFSSSYDKDELSFFLHVADMKASRFDEKEGE